MPTFVDPNVKYGTATSDDETGQYLQPKLDELRREMLGLVQVVELTLATKPPPPKSESP